MLNTAEYRVFLDLLQGRNPDSFGDADQNMLFELFQRHRLLSTISNDVLELLEPAIGAKWYEAIRGHTLKSMQLTGALRMIIGELNKKGLPVFSIKGPILSLRLFGDIGQRHFNDIDLVVRREEFLKVLEVLDEMGYKMGHPKKSLNLGQWDYYFKYKKDVALINRGSDVVVELHVGIFRQELIRAPSETFIWDLLDEEQLGTVAVKCLNLNASFLYLIYHGGQHQYFRLFWLRDVALALESWTLDHNSILEKATILGIDRLMGMGLLLSQFYFGTNIPSEYDQYLTRNQSVLLKLQKICMRRISGPERETRFWKIWRFRFVLLLQPGIRYYKLIFTNILHRRYIRKRLGGF